MLNPPFIPLTCHSHPPPHPMPPGRRQCSVTRRRHPSDTHESTFFFLANFFFFFLLPRRIGLQRCLLTFATSRPSDPPAIPVSHPSMEGGRKAIGNAPRLPRCRSPKAFSSKLNWDRIPRLLRCQSPKAISSKPNRVPSPVDSGHLHCWSLHATSAMHY